MYHFVAEQQPELRVSNTSLVGSELTQYLKGFQIEAIRYLYEKFKNCEFCVLNDESGLGKSVTMVAFLSAIASNIKILIVIQNEEHYLISWRFHLNVLSKISTCVIQNSEDTTNSPHSVYLAQWSILRGIGDLSKLNFDYIIVDHRGNMLNNNFCTSMLLKHFENKVNVVISSVDITSNVKLLYNILRLGGCLESRFAQFKSFERKFRLPDSKDVFNKSVELEEYYRQREILGDYVKHYRLRRLRHQYDQYLPFVSIEQFKSNLTLWLASNNSNSTLSNSSQDTPTPSTGGSDEIRECLMNIKLKRLEMDHKIASQQCEDIYEPCDTPVAMSPLVFESSESEECLLKNNAKTRDCNEKQIIHENLEIKSDMQNTNECDIFELSWEKCESKKNKRKTKTPKKRSNPPQIAFKDKRHIKELDEAKVTDILTSPSNAIPKDKSIKDKRKYKNSNNWIKKEDMELNKPKTRAKKIQRKNRLLSIAPKGVHIRQTRAMQRITRSAESRICNKYIRTSLALDIDKKTKCSRRKKKQEPSEFQKINKYEAKDNLLLDEKLIVTTKTKRKESFSNNNNNNHSKEVLLSKINKISNRLNLEVKSIGIAMQSSQLLNFSDCEDIQCAQKLPNQIDSTPKFRVPMTPLIRPQTPLRMPNANETDVKFISPPTNQSDLINISSSPDERCSLSSQLTQSRRTRALKSKSQKSEGQKASSSRVLLPGFGELFNKQQTGTHRINKSPDLFSNCADILSLSLTQQPPKGSNFEGFKIFGSEVKKIQQQNAEVKNQLNKNKPTMRHKSERSCLDILEQMFETQNDNSNELKQNITPELPISDCMQTQTLPTQTQLLTQRGHPLLDSGEDDIFEITSNAEFGSVLRIDASGEISPVEQQHEPIKTTKSNTITKYLIGGNGATQSDETATQNNRNNTTRKSLKTTQSTKLTRWFATANGRAESKSTTVFDINDPTTTAQKSRTTTVKALQKLKRKGPTRRKCLEFINIGRK